MLKKEEKKRRRGKKDKKNKKSNDDEIKEIKEIMDLDEGFWEEVEKEMKKGKNEDEIPGDEGTKVDLNQEKQILEKIKELKKFEKKMKFTYIVDAEWKKKNQKK